MAPLTPLSDTLALGTAAPVRSGSPGPRFHYGWVRGSGSAGFILGSILSGQAIGQLGIAMAAWLNAGLLAATAYAARFVAVVPPINSAAQDTEVSSGFRGFLALLRLPLYRRIIIAAALILGSHAMHDSFSTIRWEAAGISPGAAGLLWSLSVAAEVVVFIFLGRPLLDRLGPARAAMLAARAGIVR